MKLIASECPIQLDDIDTRVECILRKYQNEEYHSNIGKEALNDINFAYIDKESDEIVKN